MKLGKLIAEKKEWICNVTKITILFSFIFALNTKLYFKRDAYFNHQIIIFGRKKELTVYNYYVTSGVCLRKKINEKLLNVINKVKRDTDKTKHSMLCLHCCTCWFLIIERIYLHKSYVYLCCVRIHTNHDKTLCNVWICLGCPRKYCI